VTPDASVTEKFAVRVPATTFPNARIFPTTGVAPMCQKYSAAFVDAVHEIVPPVPDNELSVTDEIVLGVTDVNPCWAGKYL
jgi:hypothetical protein